MLLAVSSHCTGSSVPVATVLLYSMYVVDAVAARSRTVNYRLKETIAQELGRS